MAEHAEHTQTFRGRGLGSLTRVSFWRTLSFAAGLPCSCVGFTALDHGRAAICCPLERTSPDDCEYPDNVRMQGHMPERSVRAVPLLDAAEYVELF